MRIAQRLKYQSELVVTSTELKKKKKKRSGEHTKILSSFVNTKFICYNLATICLVVFEKQRMKNESTALAREREIKRCEKRERADTDLELSFSFSVDVLTPTCSLFLSSRLLRGCEDPLRSSPKMGDANFGHLHIVVAGVQLLSLHRRVS